MTSVSSSYPQSKTRYPRRIPRGKRSFYTPLCNRHETQEVSQQIRDPLQHHLKMLQGETQYLSLGKTPLQYHKPYHSAYSYKDR